MINATKELADLSISIRYRDLPEDAIRRGKECILDTLGWCLFLAGRTQDALGVLGEAIDRDPMLLDPRLHMAQAYAKDGRKTEAEGAIRAALKIATDSGEEAAKSRVTKVMKDLGI